MTEIEIEGHRYRVEKMNALTQLHVARRLGPALLVVGISLETLRAGMRIHIGDLIASAGPVMEVVSKMPEEDFNYVLFSCLRVVRRQQGEAWAPLVDAQGQRLMFADLDFVALLGLAIEVLKENLGNFLREPSGEDGSTKP